jgi:two-component system, OmpR family, sensor histidine kinase KdpD
MNERAPSTRFQESTRREYLVAVGIVIAVAWAAQFAVPLVGYRAIAWVFLAVVVVMAVFVGRGPTLLATVLSALLWDFFFEQPLYSFYIASSEDLILFVTYSVIAVTLGQLVAQIRAQEKVERERQESATALQLLTHELAEATGFDDMLKRAVQHAAGVFQAKIAVWLPASSGLLGLHPASAFQIDQESYAAATVVFEQGEAARKFTVDSPSISTLYLPLIHHGTAGVLGVRFREPHAPTLPQRDLLAAFTQQIAAVIQRFQMQEVSEKAKLLAESERLSKTLLNSVSHEIRTPLAVIQSATANMVEFGNLELSESQKSMMAEIQEATDRLNRLVGKLLDMARLESGCLKPKVDLCEVSELVMMAEAETRKELAQHKLTIELAPDLPPVPMDFELMLHSLANLLSNAAFHTAAGTEVQVTAVVEDRTLLLAVADRGPGIPPESIAHLFEKFYRAPTARTGGTGLGLSLVKGFVEAHGGRVTGENRASGGAAFTIRLPLQQGGK